MYVWNQHAVKLFSVLQAPRVKSTHTIVTQFVAD